MSWQDELRSLDAELADKRISSAEYRRQRDEILAAASGGLPMNTNAPFPQRTQVPQETAKPEVVPPWSPVSAMPQYQAPQYPAPVNMDDLFTARSTKQRRARPVLVISVICVLVVLGLAAGWWFGLRPQDTGQAAAPPPTTAATSAAPSPTTTTAPAGPHDLALADLPVLPGVVRQDVGVYTVQDAQAKGLFDARTADFLKADRAGKLVFNCSSSNGLVYGVFAFNAEDAQQARKITADLAEHQKPNGAVAADRAGLPGSVTPLKVVSTSLVQYSAIYTSGRTAVIVAVTQSSPAKETVVAAGLHDVMAKMIEKVPAS